MSPALLDGHQRAGRGVPPQPPGGGAIGGLGLDRARRDQRPQPGHLRLDGVERGRRDGRRHLGRPPRPDPPGHELADAPPQGDDGHQVQGHSEQLRAEQRVAAHADTTASSTVHRKLL
jgi:hypothetical protein